MLFGCKDSIQTDVHGARCSVALICCWRGIKELVAVLITPLEGAASASVVGVSDGERRETRLLQSLSGW
jgi:hypothetical protein